MARFKRLIFSEKPVLLFFYANWCEPCKAFIPKLDAIMETIDLRWVKVNVDIHQQAALQCQINSIPTLILFQKGQELWRHKGEISENELKEIMIENI